MGHGRRTEKLDRFLKGFLDVVAGELSLKAAARLSTVPTRLLVMVIHSRFARMLRCSSSSKCFNLIQSWVEKKVRRHMMHARKRKGFGRKRWSRRWLYDTLKLFNGYKVRRPQPKVAPAGQVPLPLMRSKQVSVVREIHTLRCCDL